MNTKVELRSYIQDTSRSSIIWNMKISWNILVFAQWEIYIIKRKKCNIFPAAFRQLLRLCTIYFRNIVLISLKIQLKVSNIRRELVNFEKYITGCYLHKNCSSRIFTLKDECLIHIHQRYWPTHIFCIFPLKQCKIVTFENISLSECKIIIIINTILLIIVIGNMIIIITIIVKKI